MDYVNDLKENTHKKQLFQKINNNNLNSPVLLGIYSDILFNFYLQH